MKRCRCCHLLLLTALLLGVIIPPAKAQVLFQQFYYPIDESPAGSSWWQQATEQLSALAKLGVTEIWTPVPSKGGSGKLSMGYDPYDLYDLGSKNQKGTIPTRFGTKDQYLAYIATAHANGLGVYADTVLNHSGGADRAEENPVMAHLGWDDISDDSKVALSFRPPNLSPTANLRSWTGFLPVGADGKPGTGRFPRTWRNFHPSEAHPDRNQPYHNREFAEDYCQFGDNGYVAKNLVAWGKWFRLQTGVDGMRLDAVRLIEPEFTKYFMESVGDASNADGSSFFFVQEYWDTNTQLLGEYQRATNSRGWLFDFSLYYALRDMIDNPAAFDMRTLWIRRLPFRDRVVSFVSNHDVDRDHPIDRKKRILPYAIILAMGGIPSVFYSDYFKAEDPNLPKTLAFLIPLHNRFANGFERERWLDNDVMVIDRERNLLAIFNDGGSGSSRTVTVDTSFPPNTLLRAVAASDLSQETVTTDDRSRATITAPPGGFRWYIRADAEPPQKARVAIPTVQTWEFADDLDTGRLGEGVLQTVPVTLGANSRFEALLADTSTGNKDKIVITLRDSSGVAVGQAMGKRGRAVSLIVPIIAKSGIYKIDIQVFGAKTTAKLTVKYTAPTALLTR